MKTLSVRDMHTILHHSPLSTHTKSTKLENHQSDSNRSYDWLVPFSLTLLTSLAGLFSTQNLLQVLFSRCLLTLYLPIESPTLTKVSQMHYTGNNYYQLLLLLLCKCFVLILNNLKSLNISFKIIYLLIWNQTAFSPNCLYVIVDRQYSETYSHLLWMAL